LTDTSLASKAHHVPQLLHYKKLRSENFMAQSLHFR